MEGLSRLLKQDEVSNKIRGVTVAKGSVPITHLLFADDCLIFTIASLSEARNLLETINIFSKATGKMINFQKSGDFFNDHMPNKFSKMIMRILKVQKISMTDNYLGTPLFIGRAKVKCYDN